MGEMGSTVEELGHHFGKAQHRITERAVLPKVAPAYRSPQGLWHPHAMGWSVGILNPDAQSRAEAARIVMTSKTSEAAAKRVNLIMTLLTVA